MPTMIICDSDSEHIFPNESGRESWEHCPICNGQLSRAEVCGHEDFKKSGYNFCPKCGKKL